MRHGLFDNVSALLFLQPLRCRKCLHRFFRFINGWARFTVLALVACTLIISGFWGVGRLRNGRAGASSASAPSIPARQTERGASDPFAPPPPDSTPSQP
jgi:hypothetical protein